MPVSVLGLMKSQLGYRGLTGGCSGPYTVSLSVDWDMIHDGWWVRTARSRLYGSKACMAQREAGIDITTVWIQAGESCGSQAARSVHIRAQTRV